MKFVPTHLSGSYIIELDPLSDERGEFVRTWCSKEFADAGLCVEYAQSSISRNKKTGTLRGMHFQQSPNEEVKVVSCIGGAIYDVIVDIRPNSPTYCQWFGVELSENGNRCLYVPEGFAHGFITLTDNANVHYQISTPYAPESASGLRWNDAAFSIEWPIKPKVMSEKDRSYPDFDKSVK